MNARTLAAAVIGFLLGVSICSFVTVSPCTLVRVEPNADAPKLNPPHQAPSRNSNISSGGRNRGSMSEHAFLSLRFPSVRRESNPLLQFANHHVRGPMLWKWHEYFEAYHQNFWPFRNQRGFKMLLLGVNTGGDIFMWKWYFGKDAQIFGIDLNPKCEVFSDEDNVKMFIGSQGDADFLDKVGAEAGPFDVILDDASHQNGLTLNAFRSLWKYVKPDGVYMIEDMQNQDEVARALTEQALLSQQLSFKRYKKWKKGGSGKPSKAQADGVLGKMLPPTLPIEAHRTVFDGATAALWKSKLALPGYKMYGDMRIPEHEVAFKANGQEQIVKAFQKVYENKESYSEQARLAQTGSLDELPPPY